MNVSGAIIEQGVRRGLWYEYRGQLRYRPLWPVNRSDSTVINSDTMRCKYAGYDVHDTHRLPGAHGDVHSHDRWVAKPDKRLLGKQPEYTARTMGLLLEVIEQHYTPGMDHRRVYAKACRRRHEGDPR